MPRFQSTTELPIPKIVIATRQPNNERSDPRFGQTLPGFSRKDCNPLTTDSLAHRVAWGTRSLADVGIAKFQIRFHLAAGDASPMLYSFDFRSAADQ